MYSDLWIIYPTGFQGEQRARQLALRPGRNRHLDVAQRQQARQLRLAGSYSGTCFEPIDGYKGDLARSQFYVATRYFGEDAAWPGGAATSKSQLLPWAADQYLAVEHRRRRELEGAARNAAIYEYQHNRNPFVDHPEFVSAIYDSEQRHRRPRREPPRLVMLRAAMREPVPGPHGARLRPPAAGVVALRIYDVSGRLVRSLESGARCRRRVATRSSGTAATTPARRPRPGFTRPARGRAGRARSGAWCASADPRRPPRNRIWIGRSDRRRFLPLVFAHARRSRPDVTAVPPSRPVEKLAGPTRPQHENLHHQLALVLAIAFADLPRRPRRDRSLTPTSAARSRREARRGGEAAPGLDRAAVDRRREPELGRRAPSAWRSSCADAGFQKVTIVPTDGKPGVFATLDAGRDEDGGPLLHVRRQAVRSRRVDVAAARGADRGQAGLRQGDASAAAR